MAGSRALLILAAVLLAIVAVALAEDSTPSILTPVAATPLGSYEADAPVSDDAAEDDADDAAPVGSPIGTTMTEPQPALTTPPGAAGKTASGASSLGLAPIAVVAAIATGVLAF